MNVKAIDLLKLKRLVEEGAILTSSDINIINGIMFIPDDTSFDHLDIVVIYGNPFSLYERCLKGIDVINNKQVSYILLSGGAPLPNKTETESESMKHFCIEHGVPEEKILVENRSMTTGENVIYCAEIIKDLGKPSPAILSISSQTHLRRVKMNFEKHKLLYPRNSTFYYANSNEQGYSPKTWMNDDKARKAIGTELGFIHEYLYELDYPFFDFTVETE